MTNNVELWLFVEYDRTEMASNYKPKRVIDYINEHVPEQSRGRFSISREQAIRRYQDRLNNKNNWDSAWYTTISDDDYGSYGTGDNLDLDYVELPKGTIKALTGIDLTFDDEPILFELNNLKIK